MKKIIKPLTIAALTIMLASSCNKVQVQPVAQAETKNQTNYDFRLDKKLLDIAEYDNTAALAKEYEFVDMQKINAIYALTPGFNRRAAFSLLTVNEKFAYWDNLISTKIDELTLTQTQKDLLTAFQKLAIKRVMYQETEGAENVKENLEGSLSDVLIQMNNAGIDTEIFLNIFYSSSLGPLTFSPSSTDLVIGGGNLPNCGCHRGSIVNPFKNQKCSDVCNSQTGCGFAGMFICDGRPWREGPSGTKDYLGED